MKYKMCVAGAKHVGKSSLIARFCDNIFNEKTMDTIGVAFKRKIVHYEKGTFELTIWDFGGEEKFRTLFPSYIKGSSVIFVLFDITNKVTFQDIDNWNQIIDKHADNGIIKILLGTKCDLEDQRQISPTDAKNLMTNHQFSGEYLETSAKTGQNVEKAFETAVRRIIETSLVCCPKCHEFLDKKIKICDNCGEKIQ